MKTTVSEYDFSEAFRTMGRSDQFSYDGLKALYNYLEDLGEDIGQEIELDVIAICCDFTEYDTTVEAAEYYGFEADKDEDEDEVEESAIDYLEYNTSVIKFNGGVIIQDY